MEDTMLEDLQHYMADMSAGDFILSFEGEDINSFIGFTDDSPDKQVNLFDTGGPGPDEELFDDDGAMVQMRTFQVYIRTTKEGYEEGRPLTNWVIKTLHTIRHKQIYGTYFDYVMANSAGGHIGRDGSGRDEFSVNFTARIKT